MYQRLFALTMMVNNFPPDTVDGDHELSQLLPGVAEVIWENPADRVTTGLWRENDIRASLGNRVEAVIQRTTAAGDGT